MSDTRLIKIENHRSRLRIKEIGEVFTPECYAREMLGLFDPKIWSDDEVIFFEPTCGHGNIVLQILEKRIRYLKKKYQKQRITNPMLKAVANALNTLWAIDICPNNIHLTQTRVFEHIVHILKESEFNLTLSKNQMYIAHVMCSIVCQIHTNEALSSIENNLSGISDVMKTNVGRQWIKTNTHKPIDFSLDWCEVFTQSVRQKTNPMIFKRAMRLIAFSLDEENSRGFNEFKFSKVGLKILACADFDDKSYRRAA